MRINDIEKFVLEDVRCFEGRHEFNIRPLTFLVGENSTGKSTVLGCLQSLVSSFESGVDFNSEPYLMGTFADIARKSRPRKTRFEIGITFAYPGLKGGKLQVFLKFREDKNRTEPVVDEMRWVFSDGEIIFSENDSRHGPSDSGFSLRVTGGENSKKFHFSAKKGQLGTNPGFNVFRLAIFLREHTDNSETREIEEFLSRQFKGKKHERMGQLMEIFEDLGFPGNRGNSYSIAPVRSRPRRTYDPLKEAETPEGSEIPMFLMRLSATSKNEWNELKKNMLDFGKASGLFSDIKVRHLGKLGDPFQLQITVRGPRSNLMDVGYGVSQVLPILVRILNAENTRFLLQQPEVHLHPKGQAELTSLFVDVIKNRQNSFVIETHSDYMIDRARIEIMRGRLDPEDLSLIYLEPFQNKVRVHNIRFDREGNMEGAPAGYRAFFLKESDTLLGFGE